MPVVLHVGIGGCSRHLHLKCLPNKQRGSVRRVRRKVWRLRVVQLLLGLELWVFGEAKGMSLVLALGLGYKYSRVWELNIVG